MKHPELDVLFLYQQNELEVKQMQEIERHLQHCEICQKKMEQMNLMKTSFNDSSFLKNSTFSAVKARIKSRTTPYPIRTKLITVFSSLIFLFFSALFFVFYLSSKEPLILTQIQHSTQKFYQGRLFQYPANISSKNSPLLFQIGQSKGVYVYPNSCVKFENDSTLRLKKGILIGELFPHQKTKFIVKVDDLVIKVIGTKFLVKKETDKTIVAVEHGHLRVKSKNEVDLYDRDVIIYSKDKLRHTTIKTNPDWFKIKLSKASIIKDKNSYKVSFITNSLSKGISQINKKLADSHFSLSFQYKAESQIEIRPVIDNDKIYTGTINGKLSCFNIKKGHIEWEDEILTRLSSSPLIWKNFLIITANNGYTYFINKKNGIIVKKLHTGVLAYSSFLHVDSQLIYGTAEGELGIIDLNKMDKIWSKQIKDLFYSTPILHDEQVFIPSYKGNIYAINLKEKSVKIFASTKGKFSSTKLVIFGNNLLAMDNEGTLFIYDRKSQKLIQKLQTEPALVEPIIIGNKIIITSLQGHLFVVDLGKNQIIKIVELSGKVFDSPILIGDYLFVANSKGIDVFHIHSFEKKTFISGNISNLSYKDGYLVAVDKAGIVYVYKK